MSIGIKSFATQGVNDGFLHPQEGGRLDAKRHYAILAQALDGIWPDDFLTCPQQAGM